MSSWKWGVSRKLSIGFMIIILLGGVLLSLPISSRNGLGTPLLNAIFTSTSATCVTGLVVYDTWTQFSLFGQAVILILIQCGGLGLMTIAIIFSFVSGRRIGLRQRAFLTETINSGQLAGVVRMVRRALIGTVIFEGTGTLLLAFRFVPQYGASRGIWYALFHSVSAFCNAGFDILGGQGSNASLAPYAGDPLVILTISLLILIGGIGFLVWDDLLEHKFRFKKLKLHSRIVIFTTLFLTAVSVALFFILEHRTLFHNVSFGRQFLDSFFLSVTPRTAGFSICDNQTLTEGAKLLTMILMFVGASPGGTGGGVKTSTVAVALSSVWAQFHNKPDVNIAKYRIEENIQRQAFSSIFIYSLLTSIGIFILCGQKIDVTRSTFECLSAIGTVGLSTGITPQLSSLSKIVIILLMFLGRVGSLTVFIAVSRKSYGSGLRQPVGKVIVG